MLKTRCILAALAACLGSTVAHAQDCAALVSELQRPRADAAKLIPEASMGNLRVAVAVAQAQRPDEIAGALAALPGAPRPSTDLGRALGELASEGVTIYPLPGSDLYAADSVAGTAHCRSIVFFRIKGGEARPVPGPQGLDENGSSCGVDRHFVSLKGRPAVIDTVADRGNNLAVSVTMSPRLREDWGRACRIRARFAPVIASGPLTNDWPRMDNWPANACGSQCAPLKARALDLVRQAQAGPEGLRRASLAALSPARRAKADRLAAGADPRDLPGLSKREDPVPTVEAPLTVPVLVGADLLFASLGHFTIGWRVFPDWQVVFSRVEGGVVTEVGRFALGQGRGRLLDIRVQR